MIHPTRTAPDERLKGFAQESEWPPAGLDPEVRSLCEAINEFHGLVTYESCCGHGTSPFRIWLGAERLDDLAPMLYWISGCHSGPAATGWHCDVSTDCAGHRTIVMLEGPPGAYKAADELAENMKGGVA